MNFLIVITLIKHAVRAYNLQITNTLVRNCKNSKDVYVHKGILSLSSVILHAKGWNVNAIDNIFDKIDDP